MDFIFINRYLGGLESVDFSRLRGGQQVRVVKAACTGEIKSAGCFLRQKSLFMKSGHRHLCGDPYRHLRRLHILLHIVVAVSRGARS